MYMYITLDSNLSGSNKIVIWIISVSVIMTVGIAGKCLQF